MPSCPSWYQQADVGDDYDTWQQRRQVKPRYAHGIGSKLGTMKKTQDTESRYQDKQEKANGEDALNVDNVAQAENSPTEGANVKDVPNAEMKAQVDEAATGSLKDNVKKTISKARSKPRATIISGDGTRSVMVKKQKAKRSTANLLDLTELKVSTINTTSMDNNHCNMLAIEGLVGSQLHQTPVNLDPNRIKQWNRLGKTVGLGAPCVTSGRASAGVTYQHDADNITLADTPTTGHFKKAYQAGRAISCDVVVGKHVSFRFVLGYAHVGRHYHELAAKKTSNLVSAVFDEHMEKCGSPAVFAMDLNADPGNIPFIKETLLGTEKWTDIGACASIWDGTCAQPTCATAGRNPNTRKDYIFVHPLLLRYINEVKVQDDATFATHSNVEVVFRFNGDTFITRYAKKQNPASQET